MPAFTPLSLFDPRTLFPGTKTARLGLPLLMDAQGQKHLTLNQALWQIDAFLSMKIKSLTQVVEPVSLVEGQGFVLPSGASGPNWSSFPAGACVRVENGVWTLYTPVEGQLAVIEDDQSVRLFWGGSWKLLSDLVLGRAGLGLSGLSGLGVGTSFDNGNPVSFRINKALLNAKPQGEGGSGDIRLTLNKETSGNTASLLYQSNWAGRAEMGLNGEDQWTLKVCDANWVWREALRVAPNAYVGIGRSGGAQYMLHVGGDLCVTPSNAVLPNNNGELVIEATSNTQLKLKLKGTDGQVRQVSLTLS